MTRTKPAEQRRADLLAAARALFLAKGIAATPLEDITHQAGVSKGLFYLYFHSKEDLVLALQEQFSRQLAEHVAAAADIPAGWPAKLDACVQASFERYRDLHDLHEVLFHHAAHPGPPDHLAPRARPALRTTQAPRTRPAIRAKPPSRRPARTTARPAGAGHPGLARRGHGGGRLRRGRSGDDRRLVLREHARLRSRLPRPGRPGRPGGPGGPDDARLLRAARQLFRRAAGVTGG